MLVLPTLHPAFLLRSSEGDKGEARFKHVVIDDFKKAARLRKRKPDWDESVIWTRKIEPHVSERGEIVQLERLVNLFPTAEEVERFLFDAWKTRTAVDVETTGPSPLACQLICVGLASENGGAICIPLLQQGGSCYWSLEDEARVRRALAWFLADIQTPKVFHNGAFDTTVLWAHHLPVFGWSDDTMLAHHCVDAEMPHSLAFLGSIYLETPYWKDDVKGDGGWLSKDDVTLRSYNLRDVLITIRCLPHVLREVEAWKVRLVYEQELQIAQIMARATVRGLEVDVSRRYWLFRDLQRQRQAALRRLRELAQDSEFKPSSPVQLREFLFEKLGFPVVRRSEKVDSSTGLGAPSTDKKAMTLLAIHATTQEQQDALLGLVRYRKVDKLISSGTGDFDLDPQAREKPGMPMLFHQEDGVWRVHPVWKLLVVTGRLASSPNVQNLVALLKSMFRVRKGNEIVAVDLSQAELRTIAYYADDEILLEAYRLGLNVHTLNTTLLFGVRSPGLDTNPQTEAYLREAVPRLLGEDYGALPVVGDDIPVPDRASFTGPQAEEEYRAALAEREARVAQNWSDTRRFGKEFVFADNYNATPETIYETLKAKRDRKTDKPSFPDLTLGEVEAAKIAWETLHTAIVRYWKKMEREAKTQGHLRTSISPRVKRFRAGFKITEIVNWSIQTEVANHMNDAMIKIAARLYVETNDEAQIVLQVHDALYIDTPEVYVDTVKRILDEELSVVRNIRGHANAVLPPDKAKVGVYLNQV